jgi:hypothetical protein
MIHNQLTHYIPSTAGTNMATSTVLWHYLNTSIVLLSFFHMNKYTYNNFTTTTNSFQNNTRTSIIQCFNSSTTNIIRHTTLETYQYSNPTKPVPSWPAYRAVTYTGKQVIITPVIYCIFCSFHNYRI